MCAQNFWFAACCTSFSPASQFGSDLGSHVLCWSWCLAPPVNFWLPLLKISISICLCVGIVFGGFLRAHLRSSQIRSPHRVFMWSSFFFCTGVWNPHFSVGAGLCAGQLRPYLFSLLCVPSSRESAAGPGLSFSPGSLLCFRLQVSIW
jgi:hypothetical protein